MVITGAGSVSVLLLSLFRAAEDLATIGYPGLPDGRRVTGLQEFAIADEKLMLRENVEPRVDFLLEIQD